MLFHFSPPFTFFFLFPPSSQKRGEGKYPWEYNLYGEERKENELKVKWEISGCSCTHTRANASDKHIRSYAFVHFVNATKKKNKNVSSNDDNNIILYKIIMTTVGENDERY
ncbi:hypothetical protein, unlikely [Trypanosoma brucei gambiense DAL972]|uniref:Uncharacterized protein n=1 Tax=Trypanosoma brucei gambiense (strain MHOM/CI/86/DAL972) TaxID=679716 RepID=C9ZNT6_TRYB9|nr:hypothetical protein, unlikely [Trypanosoma brucei gambiense DAL972]CBH11064.1 hypothetical protein, unlikely [Trypanosoma brucei gambiense DAL972]|eukprot:XP_011773351.1 hypothetical protein, unlikely [Trypanosoma brucei gambiense DAL972]